MAALTLPAPPGGGYSLPCGACGGGFAGGCGYPGLPAAAVAPHFSLALPGGTLPQSRQGAPSAQGLRPPAFGTSLRPPAEIAAVQAAAGAAPPDAIILSGPDFYKAHITDLYGGYKRTRNLYGKATYQKDSDQGVAGQPEAFIYWSAADSRWCVSTQLGASIMNGSGKTDEVVPVPIYQLHEEDGAFPRLQSTWVVNLFGYGGGRYQPEHMLAFEAVELPLEASDPAKAHGGHMHICTRRFVDYCFPPVLASLEGDPAPLRVPGQRAADGPITWAPAVASALERQGALFRASTEPRGDWLLGLPPAQAGRHPLFAAVREYPGHLESLFALSPHVDSMGRYYVSLFDIWQNAWRRLVIDDFVPMALVGPGGALVPWAGGHGSTLWASLLDKALAKLCGSYLALDESEPGPVFAAIAGQRVDAISRWVRDGGWWSRWCFLPPEQRRAPPTGEGHHRVRDAKPLRCPVDRVPGTWHQNSELFSTMLQLHRQNALLYAYRYSGRAYTGGSKPAHYDPCRNGLVCGHGYSVLQLVEVDSGEGAAPSVLLVQLRNPWGADACWRGAWAEGSAEWEQFPEIRKHHLRPEYHGSGRFWMLWADFCAYFDRIEVCPMPEAARKASYAPTRSKGLGGLAGPRGLRHPRDTGSSGGGGGGFLGWQCCSVEFAESR
eukprot:TRINITY_DN19557_c0_g1_i1.p1 TRINITY_DN19557_c0_g1~~TRINITY_DN19557_c0_g1_i1.p1  ORF type:complete len:664 (-),score=86.01 TRINITY_DN19557_c0_g1_i1:212-2203(-)